MHPSLACTERPENYPHLLSQGTHNHLDRAVISGQVLNSIVIIGTSAWGDSYIGGPEHLQADVPILTFHESSARQEKMQMEGPYYEYHVVLIINVISQIIGS